MAGGSDDGHLGDLLGLGGTVGLGGTAGVGGTADERWRLSTQRATVSRLVDEVRRGCAMVPADSGGFWHSDAQRAYAAQLQQLRGQLARGQLSLQDALASIDSALARLPVG